MKTIEKRKKRPGFRYPRTARLNRSKDFARRFPNLDLDPRIDAEFNAQRYLKKTPLERQIEGIVWKWQRAYKPFKEAHQLFSNKAMLKDAARTLKRADRIIKRINPWLREDPRVPIITVEYEGGKTICMKATDFFHLPNLKGILDWIANYLHEITPRGADHQNGSSLTVPKN